jgi:hypothetical protein
MKDDVMSDVAVRLDRSEIEPQGRAPTIRFHDGLTRPVCPARA